MAGAFTHLIICDIAKSRSKELPFELYKLLHKYSEFLYLGACSPDLPYLSFKTGSINWADVMHYDSTNSIALNCHQALKTMWPNRTFGEEIKFIWLLGFVSHLVADATIHPIVQATVGPYGTNKNEHRLCEMTQDSLIFNEYKNNDIAYAEFSSALKYCSSSDYFESLMDFWKKQTVSSYQDFREAPEPKLWFKTYMKAIDTAEGGSGTVAFFRHLQPIAGFCYEPKAEILLKHPDNIKKYYTEVMLPGGAIGDFKTYGFEKTVTNVLEAWTDLYAGLTEKVVLADTIKNWNLDTGENQDSPAKEITYWSVA